MAEPEQKFIKDDNNAIWPGCALYSLRAFLRVILLSDPQTGQLDYVT